jgi:2-polyprenyl-3-methyl-5-hydroxy-6-metoxy-1,4-benzoquinol methylase
MNILIIGKTNLFTNKIKEYLKNQNKIDFFITENIDNLQNKIIDKKITNVIYDYRKSYGQNIWNTSFIENKLDINIKYNLYYPLLACNICKKMNVHLTYIGEGCIFKNKDSKQPDLKVSSHSIVNTYTEKIINEIYNNVLFLRLRYPITGNMLPSCYLMKLLSYKNILDTNNSITIIEDMLPIIMKMIETNTYGIYNLFGNGHLNSINTALKLKNEYDSYVNFKIMSKEHHDKIIGERSNVLLNNSKLANFCNKNNLILKDVNVSLNDCVINMKKICKELKYCLCCKEKNNLLLDLGYQPLANDFHEINYTNSIYPLRLKYCSSCYHCQLSHSVSPEILFKNYKYVSGTSNTGKQFFKENSEFIHKYKGKVGKILDIACNDGSQLNPFKDLGWETFGVDPAENICPIAKEKGHNIICGFWNDDIAEKLPVMDVITAQNVFAHTPYIDDFLQSCKLVMDNNTSLFIQTSQRDMILNGEFDTTYHEHISFFNTKSMNKLTKRNDLVLNRVLEHSIHGRSYIFEIKLEKDKFIYNVDDHLEKENNLGLYNSITYDKFRLNAERCVENLKLIIEKYKSNGYKTIGFGAAAKGQTVVCYGNIDLDYIVDESPLKIGTYSPKLNIPIVSLEDFKEDKDEKIIVIILAWNFAKEIKEKININKGNKNIIIIEKYFPEIIASLIK